MAMNVCLTPELERYVTEKIESGLYQTASEVVCAGLRLLKEREDLLRQTFGERREMELGIHEAEQSSLDAERTLRRLRAARAEADGPSEGAPDGENDPIP